MQNLEAAAVPRPRSRNAFTLIELLVVISILGILTALTAATIFRYLDSQKQSNTETTIRTVYKVLQQHWSYVVAEADKEPLPLSVQLLATNGPAPTPTIPNQYYAPDPDQKRARVIWKTLRLVQEFPMTYQEAGNSAAQGIIGGAYKNLTNDLPPKALYKKAVTGIMTHNTAIEPATLLLLALQQNRGGVMLAVDNLPTGTCPSNIPGLQALRDAWEVQDPTTGDWNPQPLVFYRFPTGYGDLNSPAWELDHMKPGADPSPADPTHPTIPLRSPLDPEGFLLNPLWNKSAYWNNSAMGVFWFEKLCHLVHDPVKQVPRAYYAPPVIVSAGPDHSFGHNGEQFGPHSGIRGSMGEFPGDMSVSNLGWTNDNIYSFRLRIGARGD